MIDSAILFSYTRAAPGREAKALDAFTESLAFFGTAAHEGKCEPPLTFFGMAGHGFMFVPGDYDALWKLVNTEEFRELYTRTVFAVPDIAYEIGAFGQGVQDLMARWARVGKELAFL